MDSKVLVGQIAEKHVVVGEESGGWSKKSYGPSSMSIVLIETTRPYEFARISEHYPRNTRGTHNDKELKWVSSSDRIRKKVLRDIAELGPDIYIATDERSELNIKNDERYRILFKMAAEELILNTRADHIDFVIDETPLMKEGRGRLIIKDIIGSKTFGYRHVRSVDAPLVQTQDFVAGAANRAREAGDNRFIKMVNKRIISWEIQERTALEIPWREL